ncbi:MAG: enoyl-CoA hydratase/isomerase family protein [Sphingomonadales bacterium]|nr:enoyl-CoA hydratase/isomerase family protein [Sphingomonadales bacterium]
MTDDRAVLTRRAGAVTWVTLNRPAAMNAITRPMHDELEAAFNAFADDPEQRVCVVTGAGDKAFCAGSDIRDAVAHGLPVDYPPHGYAGLAERFDCPKPFIAMVNGLALGGGFELALACDLVIAADHAQFGLPEPVIGAVALGGGLHRIVRQLPLKLAMGLILSSRRMPVAEAAALGLVNEVVPAAGLEAAVRRWCEDLLRAAPLALQASKATALAGLDAAGIEAAMAAQRELPIFKAWRASADLVEGFTAFSEKRPPRWTGR